MKSSIFASSSSTKYPGIQYPITTPIPPPLKPMSTYDERLATLKPCLRFLETPRHSKAVMAAAGFSGGGDDSSSDYMQCSTCSLILFSGYFTPEPLKKHLHEAPHCPLAIQLQQEAESKHVVAKSKIESSFAPVPSAKPLSTYEERLATLTNWFWADSLSRERVAAAGFRGINDKFRARCTHCLLMLSGTSKDPFKEHLQKSSECPLVLQLEATGLGTPEAIAEASKPTPVAADIGYFDPTLLCDIQEFSLFCEAAGFVQQLRQCQHQYREPDLLALLPECFRGPALAWYSKQQSESETVKKSLSEWLEALATAFAAKPSKSETPTSSTPSAPPPPQYHSCLNCSASFSSLARLLQHTQATCQKAVCKQCEEAFNSKNKLHEHIRQHHVKSTKEVVKDASGRSFNREGDKSPTTTSTPNPLTPPTSPKTTTKFSVSRPVTPPERPRNPPTPPVTSAAIAPATPKRSRLPLPTPKLTPKPAETASVCSLTPPATPPPMLRKPQKPHLTIDDLIRMFRGKSRPFGLAQHQNRHLSPRSPRTPYQSRITAYFLPAAYQKAPITQGLKSPKPKSFQQHTPAESIRSAASTPACPEKSAFSPYKKPGISYTSLQPRSSFLQSRSSSRSSFWPSLTSPPLPRSPHRDLHVYCTCFGHSSFRNGPFNYRRPSQQHPSNRRPMRGMRG